MSGSSDSHPYQIIWLIRRLFRALGRKSGKNLEGLGISVADRAVMEFLYPDNSMSVPEIAELYKVSRQHVQVTVNSLLESGLVESGENPRHKRSPLVMLNTKGRELFGSVLRNDKEVVKALFSEIPDDDVHKTREVLQSLLTKLN